MKLFHIIETGFRLRQFALDEEVTSSCKPLEVSTQNQRFISKLHEIIFEVERLNGKNYENTCTLKTSGCAM